MTEPDAVMPILTHSSVYSYLAVSRSDLAATRITLGPGEMPRPPLPPPSLSAPVPKDKIYLSLTLSIAHEVLLHAPLNVPFGRLAELQLQISRVK